MILKELSVQIIGAVIQRQTPLLARRERRFDSTPPFTPCLYFPEVTTYLNLKTVYFSVSPTYEIEAISPYLKGYDSLINRELDVLLCKPRRGALHTSLDNVCQENPL
jgi:hypothetical protein